MVEGRGATVGECLRGAAGRREGDTGGSQMGVSNVFLSSPLFRAVPAKDRVTSRCDMGQRLGLEEWSREAPFLSKTLFFLLLFIKT